MTFGEIGALLLYRSFPVLIVLIVPAPQHSASGFSYNDCSLGNLLRLLTEGSSGWRYGLNFARRQTRRAFSLSSS